MLPDDAEFSTGFDLALLGVILLVVVGFARGVAGAGGRTPRLLRFGEGASGVASPPVAPEVGLLEPAAGTAPVPVALSTADPLWIGLTLAALSVAVLGPLWYWVGRPLYYRR